VFQMLSAIEGVVTRPGLDISLSQAIEPLIGFTLPNDHLGLLRQTNGAEGFGGYVRLFGFGPASAIDLVQWNAENFWKFAWSGQVTPYFCFAETGWGDQFAYRIDQLKMGDPSIYHIEALAMQPQKIAADFSGFFGCEFLQSCNLPYDSMTVAAREKIGDLRPEEHVTYSPSPVIGAPETMENIIKLQARTAMIIAGDLAVGMNALAPEENDFRVEQYEDAEKRIRMRVVPSERCREVNFGVKVAVP